MFIRALDAGEAAAITGQKVADRALAKFKAKHADFDTVFPQGINFTFDGDGEATENQVTDALAKKYRYEKRRKEFHDHVRAENAVVEQLVRDGWRPPQPSTREDAVRRRLVRQPDGSTVVEELD